MDERTRLIALGAIAILIVAAVAGVIIYLVRISPGRVSTPGGTPTDLLSRLPTTSSPAASPTPTLRQSSNFKAYTGPGFTLSYPANWGLVTCGNSRNFELDPVSSQDLPNIVCDVAVKPVTVLVGGNVSCPGEAVVIGNYRVARSKASTSSGDINYRWCLSVANQSLDITHRVSPSGFRATSKEDFSAQVEQMIKTIQPNSPGGS